MMLHCSNEVHAHLLHPVQARDLINQLAKKLTSSLAISPVRCVPLNYCMYLHNTYACVHNHR